MAEDAGAADLISGGRLQLGISRGSPEQVIDGWRYFGYQPAEGEDQADMARRHTEVFLEVLEGEGFAQPNPRPMFPNPPGLLRLEPHSPGLRDRIWWGAALRRHRALGRRAGHEPDELDAQGRRDRRAVPRPAAQADRGLPRGVDARPGTRREPRVSVSRSIMPITTDLDRRTSAARAPSSDQFGQIEANLRAVFGADVRRRAGRAGRAARRGRGDRRRRHPAAHGAQPARRRLQRAHPRDRAHRRRARTSAGAEGRNVP